MAQEGQVPQKPTDNTNAAQTGAGHVDLKKVLLPKKPVPGQTPQSAQRVNAGALFEQEQHASLQSSEPAPTRHPPVPKKPTAQQKKKREPAESAVAPLQTYQGDIEGLVQTTHASAVSVAAAEAARRADTPLSAEESAPSTNWSKILTRAGMIVGGIVLLAAAGGVSYLAYERFYATAPIPESTPAPFISVDATTPVLLPEGILQRTTLVAALETERQNNPISLGLIERFVLVQDSTREDVEPTPLPIDDWLPVFSPNVPPELLRTLTGAYLLGVHTYDGTQAFLLLEIDTYEQGFAGMLAWERTMRGDLLPLFNREPRPRLPEEGIATSSVGDVPQLLQTGFVDKIVANRDTRVILNTSEDILLVWAPLTPNLFVITTNEFTFREVLSRLGL